MTLAEQQCRFTHKLAWLLDQIIRRGYSVRILELNRTLETQKEYVAKGVSKTLDSRHLDKLAADIMIHKDGVPVPNEEYRQFGILWELAGGRWGGRFGVEKESLEVRATKLGWDCPHFEMRKEAGA